MFTSGPDQSKRYPESLFVNAGSFLGDSFFREVCDGYGVKLWVVGQPEELFEGLCCAGGGERAQLRIVSSRMQHWFYIERSDRDGELDAAFEQSGCSVRVQAAGQAIRFDACELEDRSQQQPLRSHPLLPPAP